MIHLTDGRFDWLAATAAYDQTPTLQHRCTVEDERSSCVVQEHVNKLPHYPHRYEVCPYISNQYIAVISS